MCTMLLCACVYKYIYIYIHMYVLYIHIHPFFSKSGIFTELNTDIHGISFVNR